MVCLVGVWGRGGIACGWLCVRVVVVMEFRESFITIIVVVVWLGEVVFIDLWLGLFGFVVGFGWSGVACVGRWLF